MSRNYKTSNKNRINYIYYGADGSKTVLIPGKDGVTEATIEILHQLDDEAYDINRNETRRHGSIDEVNDKCKWLEDIYTDVQDAVFTDIERESIQKLVQEALLKLKPQQRDLIYKLYLSEDQLSQAEYAKELGIEESSVSQKAWRARKKIKMIIENENRF